jgi:hypothetical protein
MNKEEWEKAKKAAGGRFITVHWWNMGHKTLDYSGTYAGLMKEKGIKSRLLHGQVGFRFTIELASSRTVYVTTDPDYAHGCLEAIKIFYTLLGDKQLINISGREFRINW